MTLLILAEAFSSIRLGSAPTDDSAISGCFGGSIHTGGETFLYLRQLLFACFFINVAICLCKLLTKTNNHF